MRSDEHQNMWAQPGMTPDQAESAEQQSFMPNNDYNESTNSAQANYQYQQPSSQYQQADWQQPGNQYGDGQPGYQQPSWGMPEISWVQAPQPGIIPLRPLRLSELFEGAFKAVRSNPPVMFGFSLVVMASFSVVAAVAQIFTLPSFDSTLSDPQAALEQADEATLVAASITSSLTSFGLPAILNVIGTIFISGFLALSVSDAVLGKVTPVQEAWKRFKPRFWALLGVTALLNIIAVAIWILVLIVFAIPMWMQTSTDFYPSFSTISILLLGVLIAFVAYLAITTKLVFASAIVVLENISPFKAIARSWRLTKRAFWQTLGRYITITFLTSAAAGAIGGVVTVLLLALAFIMPQAVALSLSTVLTGLASALILPITSAWTTLMYIDRRMASENFGPTLQTAALQ